MLTPLSCTDRNPTTSPDAVRTVGAEAASAARPTTEPTNKDTAQKRALAMVRIGALSKEVLQQDMHTNQPPSPPSSSSSSTTTPQQTERGGVQGECLARTDGRTDAFLPSLKQLHLLSILHLHYIGIIHMTYSEHHHGRSMKMPRVCYTGSQQTS